VSRASGRASIRRWWSWSCGWHEDVPKKRLDHFVLGQTRLLGPVPYTGGDLELELALLSVKAETLLEPFLAILEELSDAAGVGIASAALPYIGPLKKGVDLLATGGPQTALEIGLSQTFDSPRTGVYFVAQLDRHARDLDAFSVDSSFRLLDERGEAVLGVPYLVFTIDQVGTRADWSAIPPIRSTFSQLMNEISSPRATLKTVESYKQHVIRTVRASPDLVPAHGDEIVTWIEHHVERALPGTRTGALADGPVLPPLEELTLTPLL
jgi:hypothetical protein